MDEDALDVVVMGELRERNEMPIVGVHATRPDEADDVERPAALRCPPGRIQQRRALEERAVGDGGIDPRQVLEDRAPGTEIEVAHLGIAHLAPRQPDGSFRRAERGVGPRRQQAAPDRHPRRRDRVRPAISPDSEAVEDDEHDGPRTPRALRRRRHDAAICDSLARAVTAARATIPAISSGLSEAPPTSAPSIAGSPTNSPMLADVTLPP